VNKKGVGGMKKEVGTFLLAILIGILVILVGDVNISVFAQETAEEATEATTAPAKKKKQDGLVEDWLNDMEDCEDWRAKATCPLGDTKIRKIPGKPTKVSEEGEITPHKIELTDENGITHGDKNVLGVKTYFMDRGFDRVEVFPPNEYIIRGKAKEIKFWALGRKFRHTLFVKLRDFRGKIHKIKVGRLDFWGWREMTVVIPGWLPQSASYACLIKIYILFHFLLNVIFMKLQVLFTFI
jgi:hypothetical protein